VPAIYTSDIEDKLALIKEFNGKQLKGKAVIGKEAKYGYYALFENPQGNKMSLYCPAEAVHR